MKKDNDKTQVEQTSATSSEPKKARRELLGSGAMAAASMMFGLVAAACSDDSDGPSKDAGSDGGGSTMRDGGTSIDAAVDSAVADAGGTGTDKDIVQLNALLTAEYKAITAYGAGAGLISSAPSTDPLFSLAGGIGMIAGHFLAQHTLHASALVDAITTLNGTPVNQAAIAADFTKNPTAAVTALLANPTIMNVLKFAASAERGAAVSYNQVIGNLEAAKYRFLASVIEGDESQHFIVLTALVAGLVTPTTMLVPEKVVPQAFVHSFGANTGLDNGLPNNYFA